MSLKVQKLGEEKEKVDMIKAEIGALLFNLGKTHIGFWERDLTDKEKQKFTLYFGFSPFGGYKEYWKRYYKIEVDKIDCDFPNHILTSFFSSRFEKLPNVQNLKDVCLGKESNSNFVKRVFFRGCENVNSGIDKGSPKERLSSLWIANAFGSFKEKVNENYFDKQRLCFLRNLTNRLLQFRKNIEQFDVDEWVEVRNFVFNEIKLWYSHLLSDNRLPANDVTLWDQAYMTATLFKAAVSAVMLDDKKFKEYKDNPSHIRWRILGIQYDKLGLAEKGLKPVYINWYRENSKKVDDEIKKLLETEYPLGNEIYRDETGIYFLVPENIAEEKNGDFYLLSNDLNDVQDKILEIFTQNFKGEVYPAIFLTEASRGTMNIAHLIEKAKENFLKAIYPENFQNNLKHDKNANGICQVCGIRLARKKEDEEDALICTTCQKRKESRIDSWLNNIDKETIWTGDLQDENGRIALVTLKFELSEWLNGGMVNTLLIQDSFFDESCKKLEKTLVSIKKLMKIGANEIETYKKECNKSKDSLRNFLENIDFLLDNVSQTIKEKFNMDYNKMKFGKKPDQIDQPIKNILNNEKFKEFIKIFNFKIYNELSKDAYSGCKKNKEALEDFLRQVFFESIIGTKWKRLVDQLLPDKINWEKLEIKWNELEKRDIFSLSQLLLQFLLRKNPSPARLRRIWETTKNFFSDIKQNIKNSMNIKEWRCKRLIWENFVKDDNKKGKEYEYSGLNFWVDEKGNVYLISSLASAIDVLSNNKNKFDRREIKQQINEERCDWLKEKIVLKEYGKPNGEELNLNLKDAKYENFLPYFSILDPTPISYQFIIPADTVPVFIKNVQEAYKKEFKWVIGKLPLHIGIVIQNYKKPLYMGIKALRNIRRDIKNWNDIRQSIDAKSLKAMQKEAFSCHALQENLSKLEDFYSLYEKEQGKGSYKFYLNPKGKPVWLNTTKDASNNDKFIIYPNTVDFEFLDVNTRRNDIYYNKSKRTKEEKRNRPYTWEKWQIFYNFEDYFKETKLSGKLQNIVSLIYSKLNDWKENDESIRIFLLSAFINVFDLKDNDKSKQQQKLDEFAKLLGQSNWNKVKDLNLREFKEALWQFIDMFEFWHIHLKKI